MIYFFNIIIGILVTGLLAVVGRELWHMAPGAQIDIKRIVTFTVMILVLLIVAIATGKIV